MQNCIATHFLAVRDVDDFHLDRLPVQHQLLPVAQVCKSERKKGEIFYYEGRRKFASSLARMNLRNRTTIKDPHVARNIAPASAAAAPLSCSRRRNNNSVLMA